MPLCRSINNEFEGYTSAPSLSWSQTGLSKGAPVRLIDPRSNAPVVSGSISNFIGSALISHSIFIKLGGSVFYVADDNAHKKKANIDKLQQIRQLSENWDGYNAPKIDSVAIQNAMEAINALKTQPAVFPTARGSVQLEYEKDNGDYLEIEINCGNIEMYAEHPDGDIEESTNSFSVLTITEAVEHFYGRAKL